MKCSFASLLVTLAWNLTTIGFDNLTSSTAFQTAAPNCTLHNGQRLSYSKWALMHWTWKQWPQRDALHQAPDPREMQMAHSRCVVSGQRRPWKEPANMMLIWSLRWINCSSPRYDTPCVPSSSDLSVFPTVRWSLAITNWGLRPRRMNILTVMATILDSERQPRTPSITRILS